MTTTPIYLDNNATTPLAPEARAAMLPYLTEYFGNPSSGHRFGEEARDGVDQGRRQLAALLNCRENRLTITSGGSEANNMALYSGAFADPGRKTIITSTVEHPSVLAPLAFLARHGCTVIQLPVRPDGGLELDRLVELLTPEVALVSLMAANNETGVLWPIAEIGALCRQRDILFHSDAVQMVGKESLDLATLPIDYLSIGGHKLHGPKGVGALYAARNAPLTPLIRGAGQEHGKRAGTENVAAIVGLGAAAKLAAATMAQDHARIGQLRDHLERGLEDRIDGLRINCRTQPRLVNTSNISIKNCSAAAIIQELDEQGIAISAHSACHSGDLDPSHVLTALAVPEEYLHGTLRISLSRYTSKRDIDTLLELLPAIVARSRSTAAL